MLQRLLLSAFPLVVLVCSACSETSTVGSIDITGSEDDKGNGGKKDTVIIGDPDLIPEVSDTWELAPEEIHSEVTDVPVPDDVPDTVEDEFVLDLPDLEDVLPDVPEEVQVEIVEEVKPDISCTPNCVGKDCGSDGCDGVCGYCAYGYVCSPVGKCEASVCQKQCTVGSGEDEVYKECGLDGCGGYCGFCSELKTCGDDGFCYDQACTGDCTGKQCGDDGCGHSCGNCQFGEMCNSNGKCVDHPCGTVSYKGECTDKYTLVECINLELVTTNCMTLPDKMCGWDEDTGTYDCVPETECDPKCSFEDGSPKECGPDGCWGSCGVCPQGWGCGQGFCKPAIGGECAWIDGIVGTCVGDVFWFCSSGVLYGYDCMAEEGNPCGWDHEANFGAGGYGCLVL